MARAGFFNDNEYRAYPFIYRARGQSELTAPEAGIVDAGFILGLDAEFDPSVNSIWLAAITATTENLEFRFETDAPGAAGVPLTFTGPRTAEWTTLYAATGPAPHVCAEEPIWEGFIVTGALPDVFAAPMAATYTPEDYVIEPGLLQNLAKSYLRSISVGNYERTVVPACDAPQEGTARKVVTNARCLKGDIIFKEGYQCIITQNTRAKSITITASTTAAGIEPPEELCTYNGELPLFPGEQPQPGSKFLGGGPACSELIFTVNGAGGKNLLLFGGGGVQINTDSAANAIIVKLDTNTQNACSAADQQNDTVV